MAGCRATTAYFTLNRKSFSLLKYLHANPGCRITSTCSYFPGYGSIKEREKRIREANELLLDMEREGYIVIDKTFYPIVGVLGPCWLTQAGQEVIDRVNWSEPVCQLGGLANDVVCDSLELLDSTIKAVDGVIVNILETPNSEEQ